MVVDGGCFSLMVAVFSCILCLVVVACVMSDSLWNG